jgi:Holliday junction resolvasome RuvABC endonuclease subunit
MTAPLSDSTAAWIAAPRTSVTSRLPRGGVTDASPSAGRVLEARPAEGTTPVVVGLDLSMTASGVCTSDGAFTIKPKANGDERLMEIRDRIYDAVVGADLAVIEDLPANAKSAGITGRVQGIVRLTLLDAKVPYVLITAASLKKYATGKGNADKVAMGVAAMKRFGLEFADDNACDAFWLRCAGLDALGFALAAMPAVNRAALDAVAWPGTGGAS